MRNRRQRRTTQPSRCRRNLPATARTRWNPEAIRFALLVGPVYAIGLGVGAALFGRASERIFRAICYALIAVAVIAGLPILDGVLRQG